MSGDIVSAAPDRDQQVVLSSEAHRLHHIAGPQRLDDESRPPVDHPVEDPPCRLVRWLPRPKYAPVQVGRQRTERLFTRYRRHAILLTVSTLPSRIEGGRP